jgi:hypothetical protein
VPPHAPPADPDLIRPGLPHQREGQPDVPCSASLLHQHRRMKEACNAKAIQASDGKRWIMASHALRWASLAVPHTTSVRARSSLRARALRAARVSRSASRCAALRNGVRLVQVAQSVTCRRHTPTPAHPHPPAASRLIHAPMRYPFACGRADDRGLACVLAGHSMVAPQFWLGPVTRARLSRTAVVRCRSGVSRSLCLSGQAVRHDRAAWRAHAVGKGTSAAPHKAERGVGGLDLRASRWGLT